MVVIIINVIIILIIIIPKDSAYLTTLTRYKLRDTLSTLRYFIKPNKVYHSIIIEVENFMMMMIKG